MEKNKVIFAGLGQCGCILVDEMKDLNKKYSVMYLNSAIGDLSNLKNVDLDSNTFIYSAADGTGRDRKVAQEFLIKDAYRVGEFLKRFKQYNVLVAMASLDGGTGSGSLPLFIKYVNKFLPHVTINVVGVLPKLKEDNLKLRNTISCLKELEEVIDIINDIKFINNNSRDYFYNVNNANGYGVVLRMPQRTSGDIIEDISRAINNSVFAIPENLLPTKDGTVKMLCDYAAINVREELYDYDEIKEYILADKTIYTTYNKKKSPYNYIVLGGADMPNEIIELISLELEDRKTISSTRKKRSSFGVEFLDKDEDKEEMRAKRNNRKSSTRLVEDEDEDEDEDIFDADFFKFN